MFFSKHFQVRWAYLYNKIIICNSYIDVNFNVKYSVKINRILDSTNLPSSSVVCNAESKKSFQSRNGNSLESFSILYGASISGLNISSLCGDIRASFSSNSITFINSSLICSRTSKIVCS